MIINIIEFTIHKYYNKIVKYIKLKIIKMICISILIKKQFLIKIKLMVYWVR